ncbi:MAG: ABC transporter substrate-binding protein [Halobacteriaceae archaeon]
MSSSINRRKLLQAIGIGAVGGVAGCSQPGQQDTTTTTTTTTTTETTVAPGQRPVGGEYIWGTTTEATGMSPVDASDEATNNRFYLVYDGGGWVNTDIEFEPRWFETWELNDDATEVTYKLRDGLTYGGEWGELTVDDYMYNIDNLWQVRDLEAGNWAGYSYVGYHYIDGDPIEYTKVDDRTFTAKLPAPRVNYLHTDQMMFNVPIPKGLLQKYVEDDYNFDAMKKDPAINEAKFSGNLGPYEFKEWKRNSQMVLTRNEDYYLADTEEFENAPYFDQVTFQVFDTASTGYSSLKAGNITRMEIEANKLSQFTGRDDIDVWHSKYGTGIFWVNVNHRSNGWKPMRESKEVRQAFAHLTNKNTLIDEIYDGNANGVDTFHPRWGPYYSDEAISTFEPSVEKAKEKLESGTSSDYGYDGEKFVGPDGEQVELKMVFRAGSQSNETIAQFLKQQFDAAGITLDLVSTEWSNLLSQYVYVHQGEKTAFNPGMEGTSSKAWDLMYGLGFSHGAYAPWSVVRSTLTPSGGFNFWGYQAQEQDGYDLATACDEAQGATSQEEAQQVLTEMFGFLSEAQPLVWAFNDHTILGFRGEVEGQPPVENAFSDPSVATDLYFKSQ